MGLPQEACKIVTFSWEMRHKGCQIFLANSLGDTVQILQGNLWTVFWHEIYIVWNWDSVLLITVFHFKRKSVN